MIRYQWGTGEQAIEECLWHQAHGRDRDRLHPKRHDALRVLPRMPVGAQPVPVRVSQTPARLGSWPRGPQWRRSSGGAGQLWGRRRGGAGRG